MNVEIIDENNIVVDGVEYVSFEKYGCEGCEISCNAQVRCSPFGRSDDKYIVWKKKTIKTVRELFNEWCGEKTSPYVSRFILNGEISSKQIGLWRKENGPTPNAKSKAILKKHGFDWGKHADFESGQQEIVEEVVKPKKPENFTLEFEYVEGEHCLGCCFRDGCPDFVHCVDGYIIKRVKKYIPLTRETAMICQKVRQTTENGHLHGTISYIKKHQDQCVVDWGGNETTICFASLEVLED